MLITNCTVRKVEKSDPRYPTEEQKYRDGETIVINDLYQCQITCDDGCEFETHFYVTPRTPATPHWIGTMLELFGKAVRETGDKQAA